MGSVPTCRARHKVHGHEATVNVADLGSEWERIEESSEGTGEPMEAIEVPADGTEAVLEQEHQADPEGDANEAPDSPNEEESEAAPVPSIEGLNVGQVAALVAEVEDVAVLDAIKAAERADKDRKGALAAIAERREELES